MPKVKINDDEVDEANLTSNDILYMLVEQARGRRKHFRDLDFAHHYSGHAIVVTYLSDGKRYLITAQLIEVSRPFTPPPGWEPHDGFPGIYHRITPHPRGAELKTEEQLRKGDYL